MRDDNDGVFEVNQELLEPTDGLEVQVVRRLIQQEYVRVTEEGARKQHLDL